MKPKEKHEKRKVKEEKRNTIETYRDLRALMRGFESLRKQSLLSSWTKSDSVLLGAHL